MNIIFIAPPAAGKGTQAGMLKEEYNLYHLSTGDLFREMAAEDTELGREIKTKLDSGLLIEDELTIRMVKEKINSLSGYNGFIFDGFPRTVNQANMLNDLLNEMNQKVDYVISLEIEKEMAMRRACGRVTCTECNSIFNIYDEASVGLKDTMKCPNCGADLMHRDDDNEEKFCIRFDTYLEKTKPLVEYYKNMNLLHVVECAEERECTYNSIKEIIEK